MAATGWSYLMPFNGDADALLTSLRQSVFENGNYETPWIEPELLDEIGFFTVSPDQRTEMGMTYGLQPLLDVVERVGLENTIDWLTERMQKKDVKTIEDLEALQCVSSSGTHSPLDLTGVSPAPEDFKLFPLSQELVVEVFGKERVQLADVEGKELCVHETNPDAYERWQAVYVPVYTGDQLTHAYVEGVSGD